MEPEYSSSPQRTPANKAVSEPSVTEVIEGSHQTFHSDGWQQIESINTPSLDAEAQGPEPEIAADFGAMLDDEIAAVKKQIKTLEDQSEDSSFAQATSLYLTALQSSYRELQATSPHLSGELIIGMGESKACRELCSIASSQHETPSPIEHQAIKLAMGNVDWQAIPIDEANRLFDSVTGTYKYTEDGIAATEPSWKDLSNSPIHQLLENIPTKKMQELFLYTDEDDRPSAFARYIDTDTNSDSQLVHKAKFFLETTKPERGLIDMQHHPVIARLVDRLGGPAAAKIVDGEQSLVTLPLDGGSENEIAMQPEAIDQHNNRYERAIQDYLVLNLGLSRELITAISDAMKSRLQRAVTSEPIDPNTINPEAQPSSSMIYQRSGVLSAMLRIGENVRTIGAETIERLHSELGIVNIDRYSPEDLQTMVKLLDKDPATIENLQNGDVMTVFSDAYGDWNGAFTHSLDNVRRDNGRSLLFEIAKPSDLYRHMIFLKQRGIKPSSLSINAHGSPGLTYFGSSSVGAGFYLAAGYLGHTEDEEMNNKNVDVSLYQANLSRLFSEEFFQPSKGIDDAADWIGSTQLIINSCSSDVSNEEWLHSTAEVIAAKTAKPRGDDALSVIAASDVLYVKSTPEGLHFVNSDDQGIGVKLTAEILPPTKKEKITAALKGQQAQNKLSLVRTNYAVVPVSNTFRKVA